MSSATERAFERLIIVTDDMNDDLKCITTKERIYADKVPIATVETGWTGPVEGEQEKYLKLFAAAPDLLEALKAAMYELESLGYDETGNLYASIVATIKKAEGR